MTDELTAGMSGEQHVRWNQVCAYVREYKDQLHQIASNEIASYTHDSYLDPATLSKQVERKHRTPGSSDGRPRTQGFDIDRQHARRDLRKRLFSESSPHGRAMKEKFIARHEHVAKLMTCGSVDQLLELPLTELTRDLIIESTSPYSQYAGSQPTTTPWPNYTSRMRGQKFLLLEPSWKPGSKAGALSEEIPIYSAEDKFDPAWANCWKNLGDFKSQHDVDCRGWTALHHACHSLTFSKRALYAACALIDEMEPRSLNWQTYIVPAHSQLAASSSVAAHSQQASSSQALPSAPRGPQGYTAMHFACDGSSVNFCNAEVVRRLCAKRADMEKVDVAGNTPLLKACGTGLEDVAKLLLRARANPMALNKHGKSIIQVAEGSNSLKKWLTANTDAELTHVENRRTRKIVSQSRELRYATSIAVKGPYKEQQERKG